MTTKEGQQIQYNQDEKAQALQARIDTTLQLMSVHPTDFIDATQVGLPIPNPALEEEYESLLKELAEYKKVHYPSLVDPE